MITFQEIMGAYVLPGLLVVVASLGFRVLRRRSEGVLSYAWIGWLPALAFSVGYWQLYGWPGLVPVDSTQWLIHMALLSGVVGLLATPQWIRWICQAVLAGLLPWLLLKPVIQYEWTTSVATAWVAGFAVAIWLQMLCVDQLARHVETPRLLMILTMVAGATALVSSLSGSISLGKTAGILAVILGSLFLVSRWLPNQSMVLHWVPLIVTVNTGLWLSGYYYASLSPVNAILLYGALLIAWLGLCFKLESRSLWVRYIVHAMMTAIPLGIPFVRALLEFMHNDPTGYY